MFEPRVHRLESDILALRVDVANQVEVGRECCHDGAVLPVDSLFGHVDDDMREDDAAAQHVADGEERSEREEQLENPANDRGQHAEEHGHEFPAVLLFDAGLHLNKADNPDKDVGRVLHVEQVLRRYGFAVVPGFVYAEKELVLDIDEQERELCHHEQECGDAVRFGVVDALAQVAEGVV